MADRVKPLKIESPDSGGVETDLFPTSVDKNEDYLDCAGITIQDSLSNDEAVKVYRAPSGDMMFRDLMVPGLEHTLTELYLSGSAVVVEVLFINSLVLMINHMKHKHPLVQVLIGAITAWNQGGWQNVLWNGDTSGYIRLPDDQYVTTHESEDAFWVEFASPQTGMVIYF